MDGIETTGTPVGIPFPDAHQAPPGVAAGILGEVICDGSGGRGKDVGSRREVERGRVHERGQGGGERADEV